ncbi:MAG TPA: ABC transporter permease subunit [Jiangellaceae bacterium]|nr:ABC transporter permease subunit [Jiangellaceae bacterium]
MLATVFTKAVLDRWRGMAIGVVSLAVLLLFAMDVYRQIDLSIYTDLPEAFLSLVGIPEDADVASLAYNAIYSSYGSLAMGGLAIAMGAAAIAGEERKGTMAILLGNPVSRTRVLVSKAAAMLLLVALGGLVLWAAGVAAPGLLEVSVTGMHIGAFTLHLVGNTVFFGLLALAIGSWTGKGGMAAGATAGVMVLSFFAVGIFPLVAGWEDLARAFPWYYYSGSEPLLNGIHWGHIAVLAAGSIVLFLIALAGVNRRDLRGPSTGVTLMDRLRTSPLTAGIANRLAGSARVSRIWVKTASEHQGLLFVVAALMFGVMGVLIGPIYNAIGDAVISLGEGFPEALLALFGGGDLSTPEGFYQLESYGLMAPIAVMVVTITIGARALAGEEEDRTMSLLLANPIPRSQIVVEKTLTMVLYALAVGIATFAGVTVGSWVGGLGMDVGNIAATSLLAVLIGLLFGSLAMLLSAATGFVRFAIFVPVGAALIFHVMNAIGELNDAAWANWSPFHYYLGGDPLTNGMPWDHAALLAALVVLLLAVAVPAFQRRDLRRTS